MISKKINSELELEKITYPCLREYDNLDKTGECIVFFHKEQCGIVVYTENSDNPVGEYNTEWYMPSFKPYKGGINIFNE